MRYVRAKHEEYEEGLIYRIYVTDSLYLQPQNQYINKRFVDLIEKEKKQETQMDAGAIIADVMKRHGLKFEDEGEQ